MCVFCICQGGAGIGCIPRMRGEKRASLYRQALDLDTAPNNAALLTDMIRALSKRAKVVILIDEYDAPIINNLSAEKLVVARAIKDELKAFFATIKAHDDDIRFVFLNS